MSKRDEGVSRRLRGGTLLAAVLVLVGGTAAAHASWQSRTPLTAGVVASGSLDLTTQWVGTGTAWNPPYPGGFSDTPLLRVTETGGGTTLRWRVSATTTTSAALSPYVSIQVFVGTCGSSTVIPAGGSYSPAGGIPAGTFVDLCLRVTLRADAPTTLQNQPVISTLSVTATQVVS